MKKLRRKNGFTLVECVVAMAVLAIMSLLLTMILSVTLKTRNSNMQLE
ncbi:MAG: type II secretion system GspH family protein, partial [Ruminiclostridium sp.]|nr:type II secretion system GspH family protein [Ruminiclostridium sp.]